MTHPCVGQGTGLKVVALGLLLAGAVRALWGGSAPPQQDGLPGAHGLTCSSLLKPKAGHAPLSPGWWGRVGPLDRPCPCLAL